MSRDLRQDDGEPQGINRRGDRIQQPVAVVCEDVEDRAAVGRVVVDHDADPGVLALLRDLLVDMLGEAGPR